MKKILFITDQAPDYREKFLSSWGNYFDLTVIAKSCEDYSLNPPEIRQNYKYIQLPYVNLFGFYYQRGVIRTVLRNKYDYLCVDLNLRHIERTLLFIISRALGLKLVWWGHIFGQANDALTNYVRRVFLRNSAGVLTYTKDISDRIYEKYGLVSNSFNNTQAANSDFRVCPISKYDKLRLLFVGRAQSSKKIELLIRICDRRDDVLLTLIGPGMQDLDISDYLVDSGRIRLYGQLVYEQLKEHFEWCDIVACAGSVGLLVLNAAIHCRGIVIDSGSRHGPEVILARESGQPFIDFTSDEDVDDFVSKSLSDRTRLLHYATKLQDQAKAEYTIENMTNIHVAFFDGLGAK